ncbi:MAG TPA: ROK family protein [Marmoricola sp.]|nr:ROK family protein [Marmoricola sp.]
MSSDSTLITLDVGGTKIRGGIIHEGHVDRITTRPSPSRVGATAMIEAIIDVTQTLRARDSLVAGLAIATAGTVDSATGKIISATDSIAGWAGVALGERLEERFRLPVHVANDAVAFTVGEARHGAGQRFSRVLGITIGTGIGCGITVDGEPQLDMESGDLIEGLLSLERQASGRGIEQRYRQATKTSKRLSEIHSSDPLGAELIREAAAVLRTGIREAAARARADVVVVGGSLPTHIPQIRHALTDQDSSVLTVLAEDSELAPLIGIAEIWAHVRKDGR